MKIKYNNYRYLQRYIDDNGIYWLLFCGVYNRTQRSIYWSYFSCASRLVVLTTKLVRPKATHKLSIFDSFAIFLVPVQRWAFFLFLVECFTGPVQRQCCTIGLYFLPLLFGATSCPATILYLTIFYNDIISNERDLYAGITIHWMPLYVLKQPIFRTKYKLLHLTSRD